MSRRNELANKIVEVVQGLKLADGYKQEYRFVTRDPIDVSITSKLAHGEACVGVYDVEEDKVRGFGYTTSTLTVILEFYYKPKIGEVKAEKLNIILADLIKGILSDYTLDNLAINSEDVANSVDIDGIYDKIVNGSITFNVQYRHGTFDPTKSIC